MTFGTLTLVVRLLLLGLSGSLPRCARILIGLKEDFLLGVGRLTSRITNAGIAVLLFGEIYSRVQYTVKYKVLWCVPCIILSQANQLVSLYSN